MSIDTVLYVVIAVLALAVVFLWYTGYDRQVAPPISVVPSAGPHDARDGGGGGGGGGAQDQPQHAPVEQPQGFKADEPARYSLKDYPPAPHGGFHEVHRPESGTHVTVAHWGEHESALKDHEGPIVFVTNACPFARSLANVVMHHVNIENTRALLVVMPDTHGLGGITLLPDKFKALGVSPLFPYRVMWHAGAVVSGSAKVGACRAVDFMAWQSQFRAFDAQDSDATPAQDSDATPAPAKTEEAEAAGAKAANAAGAEAADAVGAEAADAAGAEAANAAAGAEAAGIVSTEAAAVPAAEEAEAPPAVPAAETAGAASPETVEAASAEEAGAPPAVPSAKTAGAASPEAVEAAPTVPDATAALQ